MIDPQIVFEKWKDPLMITQENDDEEDFFNDDEEDNLGPQRVAMTPMGMIPITENGLASSNYEFWTMHSNFNMSPNIVRILCFTDGVETVDVMSRYRARISIGKLFEFEEVRGRISEAINKYFSTKARLCQEEHGINKVMR